MSSISFSAYFVWRFLQLCAHHLRLQFRIMEPANTCSALTFFCMQHEEMRREFHPTRRYSPLAELSVSMAKRFICCLVAEQARAAASSRSSPRRACRWLFRTRHHIGHIPAFGRLPDLKAARGHGAISGGLHQGGVKPDIHTRHATLIFHLKCA